MNAEHTWAGKQVFDLTEGLTVISRTSPRLAAGCGGRHTCGNSANGSIHQRGAHVVQREATCLAD
jgi:hypothetical protein